MERSVRMEARYAASSLCSPHAPLPTPRSHTRGVRNSWWGKGSEIIPSNMGQWVGEAQRKPRDLLRATLWTPMSFATLRVAHLPACSLTLAQAGACIHMRTYTHIHTYSQLARVPCIRVGTL